MWLGGVGCAYYGGLFVVMVVRCAFDYKLLISQNIGFERWVTSYKNFTESCTEAVMAGGSLLGLPAKRVLCVYVCVLATTRSTHSKIASTWLIPQESWL